MIMFEMFKFTVPAYLKVLIPHEVESLLDFGNGAGTFPAKVCSCASVQIISALLLRRDTQKLDKLTTALQYQLKVNSKEGLFL